MKIKTNQKGRVEETRRKEIDAWIIGYLREYANTPLKERDNGWEAIAKLQDYLNQP